MTRRSRETEPAVQDAVPEDDELARLVRLPWWSPDQARQVLQAQARSGTSIVRFSARYRLTPSRLFYWRNRLESTPAAVPSAEPQPPPPFVPVHLSLPVPPPEPPPAPATSGCWLWVRLPSGVQLRVFPGTPEPLLHLVLQTLGAARC